MRKATALIMKQPLDDSEPCSLLSRKSQDLIVQIHQQVNIFMNNSSRVNAAIAMETAARGPMAAAQAQPTHQISLGKVHVYGEMQREVYELNIESFKVR